MHISTKGALGRQMSKSGMERKKTMKIRINPEKSPLKFFRRKFSHSTLILEEPEIDNQDEKFLDLDDYTNDLEDGEDFAPEEQEPTSKQYQLLRMLYLDDTDSEYAINTLGVSRTELESMVSKLVENGYLCYVTKDELELTEEAIVYITNKELNM